MRALCLIFSPSLGKPMQHVRNTGRKCLVGEPCWSMRSNERVLGVHRLWVCVRGNEGGGREPPTTTCNNVGTNDRRGCRKAPPVPGGGPCLPKPRGVKNPRRRWDSRQLNDSGKASNPGARKCGSVRNTPQTIPIVWSMGFPGACRLVV